jgi:N-acetylglucosaminyldiphosphoundecaprenol N-acetyl-beta-D-mannosaminyltransferase
MITNRILEIPIKDLTKNDILEKIRIFIHHPIDFFHIVSLNPENLVVAQEDRIFKKVLQIAQIRILDGIGVILAAHILHIPISNRIHGVDLMTDLLKLANDGRLRVMLIGGGPKVADNVIKCQKSKYPKINFVALQGIQNIKNPQEEEEEKIFSIVSRFKPHLIFVAFGSPFQELWLYKNREKLKGIICMGVGQGFDVLSGKLKRAPLWLRKIGLEWLYRLVTQPWRWRRQLRLIKFLWLLVKEKLN